MLGGARALVGGSHVTQVAVLLAPVVEGLALEQGGRRRQVRDGGRGHVQGGGAVVMVVVVVVVVGGVRVQVQVGEAVPPRPGRREGAEGGAQARVGGGGGAGRRGGGADGGGGGGGGGADGGGRGGGGGEVQGEAGRLQVDGAGDPEALLAVGLQHVGEAEAAGRTRRRGTASRPCASGGAASCWAGW